ncbi:hypothetical protein Tco_0480607 [Tanacetum coccineum]
MDTTKEQQKELDDALVAPENHLKIGKSNLRLSSNLKSKELTIQVVLDALKLTPFYNAFEISTNVPEIYMQEFWVTITRHHSSLRFKLDGKSHTVNVDNFRDILKFCPRLPGQKFKEPPLEEDILSFIRDLGHNGEIKFLFDVNVNHMHQPWRSFAAIINKCLSGKTTALEKLVFQVENKNSKKNSDMYYQRFTKVIIDYFMAKDQSIPRRNKMFWHYARDDFMFTTIRVISKHKDTQEYSAILPQHLTNQAMLEFEAFKTYRAYATGEKAPKSKATNKKTDSESSPKTKPSQSSKGKRIKTSAKGDKPATTKSKGLTVLSEVALSEAEQMKLSTERSMKEFHISHASGSGAGDKPEVPDVPEYISESEEESSTFSQGEDEEHDSDDDNEDNDDEDDDQEHDSQRTESDDLGDDFVHPNMSTYKADEEEEEKEEYDEEVISDKKISTPPEYELTEEYENQQDADTTGGEQEDEEDEELKRGSPVKTDKLREEAQAENQDFLNSLDSNMKKIIKEQVKAQTSKIMTKVEKFVTETLGAEVLVRLTNQPQTSYVVASLLSELELKKILMDKWRKINLLTDPMFRRISTECYSKHTTLTKIFSPHMRRRSGKEESSKEITQKASKSTSSSKGATRSPPKSSAKSNQEEEHEPRVADLEEPLHQDFDTGNDVSLVREWMTKLAQASGTTSSFNEFLATPIDISAFMMNRLNIQNLTQDLLTGLTYDLIKGTCKSVVELEYHLEEVFKATNDQLDWHNPEGRLYPRDLSKPLPLISDARGRQIIPYDHFINNDLEYLKGGNSSRKYTTSITKTKAADYGNVKWIEDKIPRSTWSERFYGYATNMETLKDVYSKHKIIAVTSLKIMEFFGYTHLEEITVRRQDDKLYKFREGDFKRLHREDIEDMLLLLVQGKLTNLNVDERFALNVALRMYTRRIVIQECVEDLQLAVESYQKKINIPFRHQ